MRVFDTNCYLKLSKGMDLQDLGLPNDDDGSLTGGLAAGIQRIGSKGAKALIMGVEQDMLIPISEQRHVADVLRAAGRDVEFVVVDDVRGHDAMFNAQAGLEHFGPPIQTFLEAGLEDELARQEAVDFSAGI